MSTLTAQQDLIDIIVQRIKENTGNNVTVIPIRDYTDERDQNMIVVGISNTTNVNPTLPDYDYTVDILIDCFLDEDKQGYFFQQIKNEVLDYLEKYLMNQQLIPQMFPNFPVVGLFLNSITNATDDQSNQCTISLQVIASFG